MIELLNTDCMAYMATLPDKAFDLAIVDPPYGIGGGHYGVAGKDAHLRTHTKTGKPDYDVERPNAEYFVEIARISHNQIIWGANHFADMLPPSASWIVWDKKIANGVSLSDAELAYCTIGGRVTIYRQMWNGYLREGERAGQHHYASRIHPNQKPVELYRWLLKNYAKPGWKILDTHLGSGSIALACYDLGYDLVGTEIDTDYHAAAVKRYQTHLQQQPLFQPAAAPLPNTDHTLPLL